MKKLCLSCLTLLWLAGCSSSPSDTKTTVCTLSQNGVSIETTFEHDGIKILKQTSVNTIDLETVGISQEELQSLSDATGEVYNAVEGMDYKIEFADKTAAETTIIDYSKVDIDELQEIGVVEPGDVDYIGIEQTIELNENSGFTCTEK